MGKRLTQLNEALAIEQGDYLLVDGSNKSESEKILLKNIKLTDFDGKGFVKEENGKGLSTNDFTIEDKQKLNKAQSQLISGQNIKTLNGENILGEGNLEVQDVNNKTIYINADTDPNILFDLETGIYTLYGTFRIHPDSTRTLDFTNYQRAYITKDEGKQITYVQMPQPIDNKIHYLKIWKIEGSIFDYKEEIIELANISLEDKVDKNKILDYITYEIVEDENGNKSVTITGCNSSISGNHVVPLLIEGYLVETIAENAFFGCKSLTSITIPDSVVFIGEKAFAYCKSLTSIRLPNNITIINSRTFSNCLSLISIAIPDSVETIVDSAFLNCRKLEKVAIGRGLNSIDWDAFYSCRNLKSITLPANLGSINDGGFGDCFNLSDVYYEGTQEQWDLINIGTNNINLTNATIHYNQKLATEDFVLKNGGSGGIEIWKPDTHYKVGDKVLVIFNTIWYTEYDQTTGTDNILYDLTLICTCREEHNSGDDFTTDLANDFNLWTITQLNSDEASKASKDAKGNVIHITYATKDDLKNIKINVDQTFNAESENAQSGKSVAQAVSVKMDKFSELKINEHEVTLSVDDGSKNLSIETTQAATTKLSGGQLIFHDKGGGVDFIGVGDIGFYGRRLTNVDDPTEENDAATKNYVDNKIGDISSVFDELHVYAQSLINGGTAE